jgi:hypothetical protein
MADLFAGMKDFGSEVSAEAHRLGIQGSMELASALFNGRAFVPYGPGQYTPTPEQTVEPQGQEAVEPQQEMDGREM